MRLTDWPGNYTLPDERVPFQMSIEGYRDPDDVSVVLVTRYWMGDTPPAEGWLERLKLFYRTLDSVCRQTRLPDLWLILVSQEWAEEAPMQHTPSWVRVVHCPGPGSEGSSITSGIRRGLEGFELKRRVAVARCDGDDALATDYVETLRKYVGASGLYGPAYLNFAVGVQYSTLTDEARLDVRSEGHFTAMVQPTDRQIVGPYAHAHVEVWRQDQYPVVSVMTRQPMWCEVVHEHNAVNRMRQGPALADGWKERFHVT